MRTRHGPSKVSAASKEVRVRRVTAGLVLAGVVSAGACGRSGYPVTPAQRVERAGGVAGGVSDAPRMDLLQVDNQATVYVDVYLVADQIQWRLGRIPAGLVASLRVPESALSWTTGFVRLAVIPGSQMSAEAWRDPRAVSAIAQPVSSVLSQRWTFRQPAGAGLQLLAAPLVSRQPPR
jgi:hypothetical protein